MIVELVFLNVLSNLLMTETFTNSHKKVGSYTHWDVYNPSKENHIEVTVPPRDFTFSSSVTQTIQIGIPGLQSWSPEFEPVGNSETTITYPAAPDSVVLSPSQGVSYVTYYDFWAAHLGGPTYSPPATQIKYEMDNNGNYTFRVYRESTIFRNFVSEKVFFFVPGR